MEIEKIVILDVVLAIIILVMAMIGYKNGFFKRVFHLLETVIAIVGAYVLCGPIGRIIEIYQVEGLGKYIGQYINRIIIFLGLFIILKIILAILGKIIEKTIAKLLSKIPGNKLVGMAFGIMEGILYCYILTIFIVMPFFSISMSQIESSYVAKAVTTVVPDLTSEVFNFDLYDDDSSLISKSGFSYTIEDQDNVYAFIITTNFLYENNIISYESALGSYQDLLIDLDNNNTTFTFTAKEKVQIDIALSPFYDDLNTEILTRRIK